MAHLHNRMPVSVEKDLETAWLDHKTTSAQEVLDILELRASIPLNACPVSRMVNKPKSEGKELIRPAEAPVFWPGQ
jgi:putative SOS response-associated peptidase YedK